MSSYLLRKGSTTEDSVTGLFVDLLRAWPGRETLLALLGNVFPHPATAWELPAFDHVDVEPWPAWRSGEPDVVLGLMYDRRVVTHLIVEAKLGASKSGVDTGRVGPEDETLDQLAKYQREAARRWRSAPIVVIYLTHDVVRPLEELEASLRAMHFPAAQGAVPRLAWCAWSDVEAALRSLAATSADRAQRAYANGLADVLERAGLHRFKGTWTRATELPSPRAIPLFWSVDAVVVGDRANAAAAVERASYTWTPIGIRRVRQRVPGLFRRHARVYGWGRATVFGPRTPIYRSSP